MEITQASATAAKPVQGVPPNAGTKVQISQKQGATSPAQDSVELSNSSSSTSVGSGSETAENVSGTKAFTYGLLDLDKPSQTENASQSYSAGKWTGAAVKVGALLSLLV